MFDQLPQPYDDRWDDLYVPGKPLFRSVAFWNCFSGLLYFAVMGTAFIQQGSRKHYPAMGAVSVLLALIVGVLTWVLVRYVRKTRALIQTLPGDQKVGMLQSARDFTGKFRGAVYGTACLLAAVRLLLS